jgi:hypothetical protein
MACWRSLSAGRLWRRLGARPPVAGELGDIATSLPSRTRLVRRGSRSVCAPTVARRRRRGSRRRRQASTDHARARARTDRATHARAGVTSRCRVGRPLRCHGPGHAADPRDSGIGDEHHRSPAPPVGTASRTAARALQAAVAKEERVRWNETGHARLSVAQALDGVPPSRRTRLGFRAVLLDFLIGGCEPRSGGARSGVDEGAVL